MSKTVLITGSSHGLGKALSYTFAKNLYCLILHGRDMPALEKIKRDNVTAYGIRCDIIEGEIRREDKIAQLADIAEKRDIDILINNAAMYVNREFVCTAPSIFKRVIETNLIAPILLTHRLFPIFQRKQSGLIVNINSLASKSCGDGEAAYCASKHGLSGFSKALQFDATRHNIRVIDICLGAMKTDMSKGRIGWDKFIDPFDAARMIFDTCENYKSLRITEIEIGRRNY